MTEDNRTPYEDDALRLESGTTPDDIREFVRRRTEQPLRYGDVTIWDYNNHKPNREALEQTIDEWELYHDEYVIPLQIPGVWGYIVTFLPERIRTAELLGYSQDEGRYIPFPNYIRHSDSDDNNQCTDELQTILEQL